MSLSDCIHLCQVGTNGISYTFSSSQGRQVDDRISPDSPEQTDTIQMSSFKSYHPLLLLIWDAPSANNVFVYSKFFPFIFSLLVAFENFWHVVSYSRGLMDTAGTRENLCSLEMVSRHFISVSYIEVEKNLSLWSVMRISLKSTTL